MALSREDVIGAALELLDDEGLDDLTVRRLAARLGVRHGALYWHFSDKQALLDAMAEQLLDGVADIDAEATPLQQLAELAQRLRDALLSRRDGARVVAGTAVPAPNTRRVGQAGVRAALAAGAPPGEARLLVNTLQEYVLGHTIEEQALSRLTTADISLPTTHLAPLPEGLHGREGFTYGLELLLDGAHARYASTSPR